MNRINPISSYLNHESKIQMETKYEVLMNVFYFLNPKDAKALVCTNKISYHYYIESNTKLPRNIFYLLLEKSKQIGECSDPLQKKIYEDELLNPNFENRILKIAHKNCFLLKTPYTEFIGKSRIRCFFSDSETKISPLILGILLKRFCKDYIEQNQLEKAFYVLYKMPKLQSKIDAAFFFVKKILKFYQEKKELPICLNSLLSLVDIFLDFNEISFVHRLANQLNVYCVPDQEDLVNPYNHILYSMIDHHLKCGRIQKAFDVCQLITDCAAFEFQLIEIIKTCLHYNMYYHAMQFAYDLKIEGNQVKALEILEDFLVSYYFTYRVSIDKLNRFFVSSYSEASCYEKITNYLEQHLPYFEKEFNKIHFFPHEIRLFPPKIRVLQGLVSFYIRKNEYMKAFHMAKLIDHYAPRSRELFRILKKILLESNELDGNLVKNYLLKKIPPLIESPPHQKKWKELRKKFLILN